MCTEPFQSCVAAPTTLRFEDSPPGIPGNPFLYDGFNFSTSIAVNNDFVSQNAVSSSEIVDSSSEGFPAISSGIEALESSFSAFGSSSTSLLRLKINANTGPFVAVSGYINGVDIGGTIGIPISFNGLLNNASQPNCQSASFPVTTPGNATNASPVKVVFADAPNNCIVDLLSLETNNTFGPTGVETVKFSLDEFVVCQANTSGLQGALPG